MSVVHRRSQSQVSHTDIHSSSQMKSSHTSKTKRKRIQTIHVSLRSGRMVHPENYPRGISVDDNSNLSAQNRIKSTLKTTISSSSSQFMKTTDSSSNRLKSLGETDRTVKKRKKTIYSQRCVAITVIAILLLAIVISAVIAIVVILKTPKKLTRSAVLRWNPTGTTIAGITNSAGINASQLGGPYGLALDSSGSLYIADFINNRVEKYALGASSGVTVAGQMNGTYGNDSSYLYRPVGLLLDSNNSIYVVERNNHRVQFWPNGGSTGSIIAGITATLGTSNNTLNYPSHIVGDPNTGIFYISDTANNRVMRYLFNASSGTVVVGGNGAGLNNTQLDYPIGLYLDVPSNSLFISNFFGNTVVRCTLGDDHWTLVAGNISGVAGSSSVSLNGPVGVTLDPMGNVYVADSSNHRIQLFLNGQTTSVTIAGVSGMLGNSSTLLQYPFWVTLDNQLNLYVSDYYNYRVQKFNRY